MIAVPSWSEQRRENRKGQRGLEGKKKPTRQVSGWVGLTQWDRCQAGGMNKKIGRCLSTAPSKPALVFYVKSRIHHLKVFVNLSTNYFRANIPAKGRFCLHWQKSLDHLTCKFISCGDQIVGRKECFLFLYFHLLCQWPVHVF